MPSAIQQDDNGRHHSSVSLCDRTNDLNDFSESTSDSIPSHPLRLKPLGNQYLYDGPKARRSIGVWNLLPDEILMLVLEQFDAAALLNLGHSCKFLYAFCNSDELWKPLFLQYVHPLIHHHSFNPNLHIPRKFYRE